MCKLITAHNCHAIYIYMAAGAICWRSTPYW